MKVSHLNWYHTILLVTQISCVCHHAVSERNQSANVQLQANVKDSSFLSLCLFGWLVGLVSVVFPIFVFFLNEITHVGSPP